MKTLYSNGFGTAVTVSDENKKRVKTIGHAEMDSVFRAKKEGNVRIFEMHGGKKAGVSEEVWEAFMSIHNDEETREKVEMEKMTWALVRGSQNAARI